MHVNKHMRQQYKNTCTHEHALTLTPRSSNSLNILLPASGSCPSSSPEQQDTTTKTAPALTLKPCTLLKWAEVLKQGRWQLEANCSFSWVRRRSNSKMLDATPDQIGQEESDVCERVFAWDFSLSPVCCQSLSQRQHACFAGDKRALNTFRLPAQTEWRRKGQTYADVCTQSRKDTHDTSNQNTCVSCLTWRMWAKVQTESAASDRNCAAFRQLQDKTHKTHVVSSCLYSGSSECWSIIIYSLDVSFLAVSNNYHANTAGNAITHSGVLDEEEVVGIITTAMKYTNRDDY